jgi:hypothetical protein
MMAIVQKFSILRRTNLGDGCLSGTSHPVFIYLKPENRTSMGIQIGPV